MLEDMVDHSRLVGRMDVLEGVGRRRRWSAQEKGWIVAASFSRGANVSEIARQNDISPQHLFQWRQAAKAGQLILTLDDDVAFAPLILEEPTPRANSDGGVTVKVAGAMIMVTGSTDLTLLAAVVRALKVSA
jgi:transposase